MSLFSKNWYRVEQLKPRLKPQVEIAPQQQRGERVYALRDPVSGSIQLFSEQAYTVLGLMNGERTLDEIWTRAGDLLKDELPTQEDVIALVSSLYQLDMLYLDIPANTQDLFVRSGQKRQKKALQRAYSPLSVQIPLFDPSRLLDIMCPFLDRWMKKPVLLVYVLTVLAGVVVTLQHLDALTHNAADRILGADNLFLLWVLYPLIKIVHELGHGYAVRRYGGNVHEVGIMFLVFFPMPYVNASESAAFSSKYQRIAVASAGMLVELFIGAVAVILWSMASDGLAKSILYNLAFMAGVSTLLFNGNPLLKFDAYYMLSDYLEIPNLAKKSVSYWGYLFKKYLFRFHEIEDPCLDTRERYWLFFYNLFSFSYRIIISISIILFIGSQYFLVGVVLGIWTAVSSWLIPFVKTISKPFNDPQFAIQSRHPKMVMLMGGGVIWLLLFQLPLPYTYSTTGVSWPKPEERLYPEESGFVADVQAQPGGWVEDGQDLVTLTNFDLLERLALVDAQLNEARNRMRAAYQDRTKSGLAAAELTRFQEEKADIEAALKRTRVTAKSDGQVVMHEADGLPDRYLRRGEIIGYVLNPERPLRIRVAIEENAAEQVLRQVQKVSVRPASNRNELIDARMASIVPRVGKEIPSAVLSTMGGGDIVMDPAATETLQAMQNYVVLEVETSEMPMEHVFERFYVRFDLPPEPLFKRLYRQIRQVFLQEFDV